MLSIAIIALFIVSCATQTDYMWHNNANHSLYVLMVLEDVVFICCIPCAKIYNR